MSKQEITENNFISQYQAFINWTLPGLTFYYRDTNDEVDVEKTYPIGKIIRSGFFIDTSSYAKKPCSRIRFIIASAHNAELHKTDICDPFTKECKLCVLHPNSYLKVMDIYKVKEQYQVFLLHIPFHSIPLISGNVSFNVDFGNGQNNEYLVDRARKSFDEKLKMDADEKLESEIWKDRTKDLVGIMADGSYASLKFSLDKVTLNLELGCRKIANDVNPINFPVNMK